MKSRFKALQELGTLLASAKDTTTAAPALNAAIEKAQQANTKPMVFGVGLFQL